MNRVQFVTEQSDQKQKVLIITETNDVFVKELKSHLVAHDLHVFISAHVPEKTEHFSYCFVISQTKLKRKEISIPTIYIVFRSHSQKKTKDTGALLHKSKQVIIIGSPEYAVTQIQTIIWFAISQENHSPTITLESPLRDIPRSKLKTQFKLHFSISPHLFRLFIFLLVFLYVFSFWIPLGVASIQTFQSVKQIQARNLIAAKEINKSKKYMLFLSQFLYNPVRPLYLFFSLAQFSDDLFVVNETESSLIQTGENLISESQLLTRLILQKTRGPGTAAQTRKHFDAVHTLLSQSEDQMLTLYRKIPAQFIPHNYKLEFQKGISQLRKAKKLFSLLPGILGESEEQSILLLFANNMEIRPGGGFIGSYGVLKTQYFGIKEFAIYDVYDADGQLTAHITPPNAIRDYLGQPHWYLRDSAFFPDFYDTYQQATYFLQKEMGLSSWNGAALITTSAVKNIIGAFDEVILPDYNEKITKDNFYIKTQYYAEHDFFPGSTQKKSFLSSLVNQLLSQAEIANPLVLSSAIIEGFDQKNTVLYMNNEKLQKNLDELFWSGRLATPFCSESAKPNCFADFQFAMDANLGVNKTNFFVDKSYNVATSIDDSGLVTTHLSISYINNSLTGVFPGGSYRNYFQLMLPNDSLLQGVQVDGQPIPAYDAETGKQKLIGFFFEIPPQTKKVITISYTSSMKYKAGKATYQLVLQKQIGALSHDVHFSLSLPSNMNLLNTNFSPLVKNNLILYNTDLSMDRVFFIELLKEHL